MKKFIRALSMLVCMAMLMTSVPAGALAEALEQGELVIMHQESVQAPQEEAAQDISVPEAPAELQAVFADVQQEAASEPEEIPADAPSAEAQLQPEVPAEEIPAEEPAVSEQAAVLEEIPAVQLEIDPIDYSADEGKSPAFVSGYAHLVQDAAAIYSGGEADAALLAQIGAGVVYVLSRSEDGARLELVYNNGVQLEIGWADAACLRPMNPADEVPAYLAACAAEPTARVYGDGIVLCALECSYVLPDAPEADAEVESAPEAEEAVQQMTFLNVLAELNPQDEGALDEGSQEESDGAENPDQPEDEVQEEVRLSASNLDLSIGSVYDLRKSGIITGVGEDAVIIYKNSDEKVLSIDEEGVITAKSAGAAEVSITVGEEETMELLVTVYPVAREITLNLPASLGVGSSAKPEVRFPAGSFDLYTITSSQPEIIGVEADGSVKAHQQGSATITVTTAGGVSESAEITAVPAPETISISCASQELYIGQTGERIAASSPEGTLCSFIYASSDETIATVDANGNVQAHAKGQAVITVTADNNPLASAQCTVNVYQAPTSIKFKVPALEIGYKDSYDLKQLIEIDEGSKAEYTFATGNWRYVSVTQDGVIQGLNYGGAYIFVTTQNGLSAYLPVYVRYLPTAAQMNVTPAELILGEGGTGKVNVSFWNYYYGTYQLTSSNDEVAVVEADGTVQAVGKGEATITVSLVQNPNVKKSIKVSVKTAPDEISANMELLELGVGQVSTALKGVCADDYMCDFIYSSNNEAVAKVDAASGAITAVGKGEAEITITADNNPAATAKCTVKVTEGPKAVRAKQDVLNIGWNDSYDIRQLFEVEGGSVEGLTFISSHPAYVSVTEEGEIKGLRVGASFITASSYNGLSARVLVYVGYVPTANRIAVSPAVLTLGVGGTGRYTVQFAAGYNALYSFTSLNEEVAKVNADGSITAVGEGAATIKMSLVQNPAVYKNVTVKVLPAPESISVSRSSLMLNVGQTSSAVYGVNPNSAATACSFIYSSSDPDVATVDAATGKITAVGVGRADIIATAANNPEAVAKCALTVVKLDTEPLNLGLGDVCDLKGRILHPDGAGAGEYTFASGNWRYVSVSADGVLTALRPGSVWVYVASPDGLVQQLLVNVRYYPTAGKISLSPAQLTLGERSSGKLAVNFQYGYAGLYKLTSSREDVAKVDDSGNITAVAPGETVITAALLKNPSISATALVKVVAAPETIEASAPSLELGVGEVSAALKGVCPQDALCNFIYASSDATVAAVDAATGAITALKAGQATITITADNNPEAKASCEVVVKPAPTSIKFKVPALEIGYKDSYDLKQLIEIDEGSKAEYTFATGNWRYVSVTQDGVIQGLNYGGAYIFVTTQNGLSAYLPVYVRYLPTAAQMNVTPAELILGEGGTGKVNVSFWNYYYGTYQLTSSNDEVAVVEADGTVRAVGKGEATIAVSLVQNPNVKKSIKVSVKTAPDEISANMELLELGVGQVSTALKGVCADDYMCDFIYSSNNEAVAKVDAASGAITAVGKGEAEITITADNNPAATAKCTVKVTEGPKAVRAKQDVLNIGWNDSYDIRQLFEVEGGSVEGLTFISSHPAYVSVTEEGEIKGLRVGASFITASSYNGLSARVLVYVGYVPTANRIAVSPAVLTLGVGGTGRYTVQFAAGYNALYSFTSLNEEVAKVNADGSITAVGEGTATIKMSLVQNPAVYKNVTVKVLPAPESITATETWLRLGAGQVSTALQGICPEDALCGFVYTSSNERVVSVDASTGKLTAVGKGIANVTIAADNNPEARAVCRVVVLDAPLHMELEKSSMYIGYGDSYDLKQLIATTAGSAAGYTFATTNKNYVSVTADGIIKGLRVGSTAYITVKTHNGLSDVIQVTVLYAPYAAYLTPETLTMGVGMQQNLNVSFGSAYFYSVHSFTSSDEEVATVDANGRVTAHKPGKTTITVETFNGLKDTTEVRVLPGTQNIEFAQTEYSISTQMKLQTELKVDEDTLDAYIYKSNNENVVTIDENGVLTGVKKGTATIEVSTASGVSSTQTCTVTVTSVPHTLDFNSMPDMVIAKGYSAVMPQPYALDEEGDPVATTFTYSFPWYFYAYYAKIEGNTITGVLPGTIQVRATSHNGKSIDFYVKIVNDTISGIELDHSAYTLYINDAHADSVALNGKVVGSTANFGAPRYSTDDDKVAIVSEDGVVTAVGTGTATITAEAYTGITASCEITVGALTTSVAFESEAHTITDGEVFQLTPVFDENTGARMRYESADKTIAVVDEKGVVTAIAPGSTTITGTTQHGLSAQLSLKVLAVPTGISMNVSGLRLAAGESVVLKPEILKDEALPEEIETDVSVSYSTSAEGIARVEPDGTVIAIAPGEAIITATTCNGLTAGCTVTVLAAGAAAVTEFAFKTATMINGDSAKLEFNLSKDAYERGFTILSSDEDKLYVNESNWTIVATGASEDGVELTLNVNPPEGAGEAAEAEVGASCTVKILAESKISFSEDELVLRRSAEQSSAELHVKDLPADLIGTFELYVEDEAVAGYDPETGLVQAMDLVAQTRVICRVFDREIACTVRVVPAYRALIISEFNNSKQSNDLPFAQSNVDAMYESLYMAQADGQMYDITVLSSNPTQAQIESTIKRTFADAREGDVSLVYIVSHGYYNGGGVPGYCFGTPGWSAYNPDSYITSSELYGWLEDIKGQVVLVLDSCKSGGFIVDNANALINNGNIAVITAQVWNKNASFFIKADGSSIEFLTYALCWGLGYDYENGASLANMAADANKNGQVTLAECFQYTKNATTSLVYSKAASYFYPASGKGFLVPGVWNADALKSWGGQVPQYYIPSSMTNLVIYEK